MAWKGVGGVLKSKKEDKENGGEREGVRMP